MKNQWRKQYEKKSMMALFMALLLSFVAFVPAYAEELEAEAAEQQAEEQIEPRTMKSKSVMDQGGNNYRVTGTTVANGSALVATSFKVTSVGTNWEIAEALEKTTDVSGQAFLVSGSMQYLGDSSYDHSLEGGCGVTRTYGSPVVSVSASHSFSCNKAEIGFVTSSSN